MNDDLISRQAAIVTINGDKFDVAFCNDYEDGYNDGIDFAISTLSDLPSTQIADVRKNIHGEWLKSNESALRPYMCSNCGCLYDVDTVMGKIAWNYCPNCGAKMRDE